VGLSPRDRRDSLAEGYLWATRASSIALTAVVPAVLGYWLDRQWNTSPWLVIVGAGLGLAGMISELMALTRPRSRKKPSTGPAGNQKT
jgi:F0F1-type ATP synthase assembly protein I